LLVGDVNSTVACARVAKAHGVPVVHVEAGLRSFDHELPEELNRVETDRLSDLLFVTEQSGMDNLAIERVAGKDFLVGNVMIDTLGEQSKSDESQICALN
jgi:UDP-N-acetylglucosamine 2-epimerase (non-hydrolysing)